MKKYTHHQKLLKEISVPESDDAIYMLGYIWADGYVDDYRVALSIVKKDANEIEDIMEKYGFTRYEKKMRERMAQETTTFILNCTIIATILCFELEYGVKSLSSPSKVLERIPKDKQYLFWRGYFDGDGWIRCEDIGRYAFGMAGNINQSWTSLENLCKEKGIDYKYKKVIRSPKNSEKEHKGSLIRCQNIDGFFKFFDYIYQDRDADRIGLYRKYERYLGAKKVRSAQLQKLKSKSKAVKLTNIETGESQSYKSITKAARDIGMDDRKLGACLKGKRKLKKYKIEILSEKDKDDLFMKGF